MWRRRYPRAVGAWWRRVVVLLGAGVLAHGAHATLCGGQSYPFPYTDVSSVVGPDFCPGILEAYVLGVTQGTTPTTFSPMQSVNRTQMTTFLQRSIDQTLKRSSRRATLGRWWLPGGTDAMQSIVVGDSPSHCAADGDAIWVANDSQVVKIEASTGKVLDTWAGAIRSRSILAAGGRIFATGDDSPGKVYVIDAAQAAGAVTVAATGLGNGPFGIAYDGRRLWTANASGSISIVTVQEATPYPVTNVSAGFVRPVNVLYDGSSIWVVDNWASALLRLDANGAVVQTVSVGAGPTSAVFDGTNIWVANASSSTISVVQAATGATVATILADGTNQLFGPAGVSFDGERVLVTNFSGWSLTVFKAADLSFVASVPLSYGAFPRFPCSDGIDFWVPQLLEASLLRF